jgi:hypothetical protein
MRSLSSDTLRAILSSETDEVFLVLITISHEELTDDIRVCSNSTNITSRSNTYYAYPFDLQLPSDEDLSPPRAQIIIDNISKEISDAVRVISSPATFTMEIIRAADPDVVEASWQDFKLHNVKGDAFQLSGDLTLEDVIQEPYPGDTFSPSRFRGLFA